MSWVFQHSETTGNDRLVLLAIADRCNDEGTDAHPSVSALARKARCSDRTVLRALESLEACGAIGVERQLGRANRYTVVMQLPLTSCQGSKPDTPDNLSPVTPMSPVSPVSPVSQGPMTLVSHSTSCTSSTHTPRAREAASTPEPVLAVTKPKRGMAPGPLAGSLPRDFVDKAVIGRLVIPQATLTRWALRYAADVDEGRAAVSAWLTDFAAALPPDAAIGDALWLERHFDAFLVSAGRVAPAPVSAMRQTSTPPATRAAVPDARATRTMMQELLG